MRASGEEEVGAVGALRVIGGRRRDLEVIPQAAYDPSRNGSASSRVCARHCRMEFMKHVLFRLDSLRGGWHVHTRRGGSQWRVHRGERMEWVVTAQWGERFDARLRCLVR